MPHFDPELIQVMRNALEEVMKRVSSAYSTPSIKTYLAQCILTTRPQTRCGEFGFVLGGIGYRRARPQRESRVKWRVRGSTLAVRNSADIRPAVATEYRHGFNAEQGRVARQDSRMVPQGPNAARAAGRHGGNGRCGMRGLEQAIDPVQLALRFKQVPTEDGGIGRQRGRV